MLGEMEKRALASAKTTASLLAMDSQPYIKLTQAMQEDPESIDEPYYSSMQSLLCTLRDAASADYLYTHYKVSDTSALIILDSQGAMVPPTLGSQSFALSSPGSQAYAEAAAVTSGLMEQVPWGESIFAHAPIIDPADGKVLGVVSSGFAITTLEKTMKNMFFLILGLFFLIIILVSLALCIVLHLRERSLEIEYLTQLGTKRHFENQLKSIVEHNKTHHQSPFALLLLDIDGFKLINDTYGHLSGDKILKAVGAIIRENTNISDICSRIGGDEFAVILTSSPLEQALVIARTIQNAVCEHRLEGFPALGLSISIGVAQWNEGQTTQELIEQADQALYKAKKQGKNTVTD